jgi:hypothetical protein
MPSTEEILLNNFKNNKYNIKLYPLFCAVINGKILSMLDKVDFEKVKEQRIRENLPLGKKVQEFAVMYHNGKVPLSMHSEMMNTWLALHKK